MIDTNSSDHSSVSSQHGYPGKPTYDGLFVNKTGAVPEHGIIICGHRGGAAKFAEPENTMRAFQKAVDLGLTAIEFDVSYRELIAVLIIKIIFEQIWLTSDDHLVIVHGGNDGELTSIEGKTHLIFDLTLEKLQNHFKESSYFLDSP